MIAAPAIWHVPNTDWRTGAVARCYMTVMRKINKKLTLNTTRLRELTSAETMRVLGGNSEPGAGESDPNRMYVTIQGHSCTYHSW